MADPGNVLPGVQGLMNLSGCGNQDGPAILIVVTREDHCLSKRQQVMDCTQCPFMYRRKVGLSGFEELRTAAKVKMATILDLVLI